MRICKISHLPQFFKVGLAAGLSLVHKTTTWKLAYSPVWEHIHTEDKWVEIATGVFKDEEYVARVRARESNLCNQKKGQGLSHPCWNAKDGL
jgi:hypothetical protein